MEKPYISRKEQSKQTQRKIFDTFMLLIKKQGYSKITIRGICQQANISIGTFYLYFSSKDEILLDLYNRIDQKVTFTDTISHPSENPDADLICQDFISYFICMVETLEKELLKEIYRTTLLSGNNKFINHDTPLYQRISDHLSHADSNEHLTPKAQISDICNKIFMFVQSYIFQWLVDDNLSFTFLTNTCIADLRQYLSLFLSSAEQ